MRILLTFVILLFLPGCHQPHQAAGNLQQDNAEISKLADKALLSNDPVRSFQEVLPSIRSFASVDSAWISGMTLFVRYKGAGIVSWTAGTQNSNK